MTLGEAWSLWFNGQIRPTSVLWGMELFWWGRLGKGLQLCAGATIVAEIIGAPALRCFGNALHDKINLANIKRNIKIMFRWIVLVFAFLASKPGSVKEDSLLDEMVKHKANWLNWISALVLSIVFYFVVNVSDFILSQLAATILAFGIFATILSPILLFVLTLFLSGIGLLLDIMIIEPMAWLLEREWLDRWIKAFALVMLLIGFHFDFLVS